jgi:hypothetical protein
MIESGAHLAFVAWSYAGVGLVVLGLVGHALWNGIRVRRRLQRLELAGIRRRSDGGGSP